jgi:hypothetical protein
MALRSDERAAQAEIERSEKLKKNIQTGVKTAASLGISAIGGGLTARLLPLLSEYIPTELAVKGISKISPQLGSMLNAGMASGLDIKEGLNFLKDKISSSQTQPNQRSIIEQYSPELFQFLRGEIEKGRKPLEAGALAETSGKFKNAIEKMVKDHKVPFSSILQTVFGGKENIAQKQPEAPQAAQAQQQPGQGQQALMAILQKIQASKGQSS